MANLTTTAANKILDHVNGVTSWTPTTPLKVALMTVLGSAASAGTEVTGGSYARQTLTPAAASGEVAASSSALVFASMPACMVVGLEVYDSAGTPVRIWWGPLAASRTLTAGDSLTLATAAITDALS